MSKIKLEAAKRLSVATVTVTSADETDAGVVLEKLKKVLGEPSKLVKSSGTVVWETKLPSNLKLEALLSLRGTVITFVLEVRVPNAPGRIPMLNMTIKGGTSAEFFASFNSRAAELVKFGMRRTKEAEEELAVSKALDKFAAKLKV